MPLPNLEIGKRARGLNTSETEKNPSLSEDLTVILLRGNGSPRTFRFSLPALQRSLSLLGLLFALAVSSAIFLLFLNLFQTSRVEKIAIPVPAPPVAEAPEVPALPAPAPAPGPTLWQRIVGTGTGGGTATESREDSDLRKEVEGLREELTKLNGKIDGRHELANGANTGLLQFFGPRSQALAEDATSIRVRNVKVERDPAKREIYVDFEIHNVDPEGRQARGYIVVLAKTASLLVSYPDNAFNPAHNIVLDYTKGETFGVSRFRPARAVFADGALEGKKPRFQVLLFASDGKVIADLHVEEKK